MNKLVLLLVLPLMAFTMIYNSHPDQKSVDGEFNNIDDNKQDAEFRILQTTPVLSDLKDHEIVIISSNGANGMSSLMWRDNVEIFSIRGSCVTVLR